MKYVVAEFRTWGENSAPGMRSYSPYIESENYMNNPDDILRYIAIDVPLEEAQRLCYGVSAKTLAWAYIGIGVTGGNLHTQFAMSSYQADAMNIGPEFRAEIRKIALALKSEALFEVLMNLHTS